MLNNQMVYIIRMHTITIILADDAPHNSLMFDS
jgi:hypothetical protein